ncbi:MAG: hypothetical protein DRR08_08075, partial [Candidatus Parabeggiatoa sp. nov. 2]
LSVASNLSLDTQNCAVLAHPIHYEYRARWQKLMIGKNQPLIWKRSTREELNHQKNKNTDILSNVKRFFKQIFFYKSLYLSIK